MNELVAVTNEELKQVEGGTRVTVCKTRKVCIYLDGASFCYIKINCATAEGRLSRASGIVRT
jgi:hypothetical protein